MIALQRTCGIRAIARLLSQRYGMISTDELAAELASRGVSWAVGAVAAGHVLPALAGLGQSRG